MPTDVDGDKVRAEFKEGVLTVFLPKAAAARPAQIDVNIA
jgi:HSP20 family protein